MSAAAEAVSEASGGSLTNSSKAAKMQKRIQLSRVQARVMIEFRYRWTGIQIRNKKKMMFNVNRKSISVEYRPYMCIILWVIDNAPSTAHVATFSIFVHVNGWTDEHWTMNMAENCWEIEL